MDDRKVGGAPGYILDIFMLCTALFRAFLIYSRSVTLSCRGSRGPAPIPERVGRLPARVKPSTVREGRRELTPHLETRCKQPRVNLEGERAAEIPLILTTAMRTLT